MVTELRGDFMRKPPRKTNTVLMTLGAVLIALGERVQAAFLLVSGVYHPIGVPPGWVQALAQVSPVTYVLNGVRAAIMDSAPFSELAPGLVIGGLVSLPLGTWNFQQAERYAKRTGKLKRVG